MNRLLFLLLFVAASSVGAAELVVGQPSYHSTNYNLSVSINNPGEGTYNEAELFTPKDLHLAGLNPSLNLRGPPSGDSFTDWNAVFAADGTAKLTHGQLGWNVWDEELMNLGSVVRTSVLEENGGSDHQPFTLADVESATWDPSAYDGIIVRSNDPLLSAPKYRSAHPEELLEVGFVATEGIFTYSAPSRYYLSLSPDDFAGWTDFASEHPGLHPAADENGNGRSIRMIGTTGFRCGKEWTTP